MFDRLRVRHGVRSYLAHNMTVTPANVHEIAEVVRVCRRLGYRMCSFQPAAYVGNERRWSDGCEQLSDDLDPRDLAARDAYLRAVPTNLRISTWPIKVARIVRALAARPAATLTLARWSTRFAGRVLGSLREVRVASVRRHLLSTTYVMHRFMDAGDVRQAWGLLERGIEADDLDTRATQERLQACAYGMGHPESDRVVPACVQHSVLDPAENQQLIQLLPPRSGRRPPVASSTTGRARHGVDTGVPAGPAGCPRADGHDAPSGRP